MKKIIILCLTLSLIIAMGGCSFPGKEVQMIVYLDADLTAPEARSIGAELSTFPDVLSVTYVSAESILESYSEIQEGTLAIEDADLSTLRDRYIVTANNKNIEILAGQISDIKGVNEVTAMVIPSV